MSETATLQIYGFHTDCSACRDHLQRMSAKVCSNCGATFTHVSTHFFYKLGRDEKHMTMEEYEENGLGS